MEVIAKARHIRMSPKKVRLVADLIRGMDVNAATAQLRFVRKAAARPVLKLLNSALANAEHNFKIEPTTLFVKTIMVDGGPVLHRWRPRAHGRATPIRKRSSHITLILDVRGLSGKGKGIGKAVVAKGSEAKKSPVAKKTAKKSSTKNSTEKKAVTKSDSKKSMKKPGSVKATKKATAKKTDSKKKSSSV